jgi:hypothetical protein
MQQVTMATLGPNLMTKVKVLMLRRTSIQTMPGPAIEFSCGLTICEDWGRAKNTLVILRYSVKALSHASESNLLYLDIRF